MTTKTEVDLTYLHLCEKCEFFYLDLRVKERYDEKQLCASFAGEVNLINDKGPGTWQKCYLEHLEYITCNYKHQCLDFRAKPQIAYEPVWKGIE